MTLHDKHLQQALLNAPDQELLPSDATRHAVLTYANEALRTRHGTWFGRLIGMLNFSSWQLATVGSVFATLLIMVVFWHERPDESMWGASAPTVFNESAVDAVSSEQFSGKKMAEATLEEKSLAKKQPIDLSKRKEVKKDIQALKIPTNIVDNKERAIAEVETTASASTAVDSVPATIVEPNTNLVISAGKVEDSGARDQVQMASKSNVGVEAQSITKNKATASVDAIKSAEIAEYDVDSTLASAISSEGGKVKASNDIKKGILRQIYLEAYLSDVPPECGQKTKHITPAVDEVTGYPVELIPACYATASLVKEVAIYNQTMREWHIRGVR